LQLTVMLLSSTSVIYLTNILISAETVVEYNIYYKVYYQIFSLFIIIIMPLWSAITKAYVEKDLVWIRKIVKKISIFIFIIFAMQFLMIPFMQLFFNVWLGDQTIPVNFWVEIVFSFDNAMLMIYSFLAYILNGLGELKRQLPYLFLGVLIVVIFSVLGVQIYNHYISIILARSIALIPYCISQAIWLKKFLHMSKTEKI